MSLLSRFNLPFKIVVSVTILAVLIMRMDPHILADLRSSLNVAAWSYAALFTLAQFLLLSLRWKWLINVGKRHLSTREAVQINLVSQLANLVFITSVGGILARVALSMQHGASFFKTLIATAFDRLMTLCALLLLSALFLPGLARHVDNQTFMTLSGYISLFVVTLFLFGPLFLNFVILRLPHIARFKGNMRYGIRYLRIMLGHPMLTGRIVLLSLTAQISFFISVFALSSYAGTGLSFLDLMTVLPLISLVAALPVSIGGWGIREGAFVYGLGQLGVRMETAFLISVQVGLIGMLVTVVAGLPLLMTSDFRFDAIAPVRARLARIRFR